jgi:hypothetical protein
VAHGEEVEGDGEEETEERIEAVRGAFSWNIVATRGRHRVWIKIRIKIRRRQRHKSLIVNYEHGRLGITAPTGLGALVIMEREKGL